MQDVPILGHFYNILKSPSENRKLREHLNIVETKFAQFTALVKKELIASRKFNDKILEIIDAGFSRLFTDVQNLKCDVASLASLTVFQQTLNIHKAKMDELFYASKHGKLTASLPQTLTLEDLDVILHGNPKFKDTLYVTHPEILYRVGHLYLMNFHQAERFLLFHFLLSAPRLKPSSLFKTYYPIQVPITVEDNSLCFKPDIPTTIIIQDDKLVAADTTDCTTTDDLVLCQQSFADSFSPNVKNIPCLNGEPDQCTLQTVTCEPSILFTKAGALVFSQHTILGMKIGETSQLTVLNKLKKYSYFFSWSKYKMIQADQKVIYSLDNQLTVKNLTWHTKETALNFANYVRTTTEMRIADNITNLRKEVNNLTAITNLDFEPNFLGLGVTRKTWMDFTSIFSIVTTVLSILGVIGVCFYNKLSRSNRAIKIIRDTLHREKTIRRRNKYSQRATRLSEAESLPELEETTVQDLKHVPARTTNMTKPSTILVTEEISGSVCEIPTYLTVGSQTEETRMEPNQLNPSITTKRQITDAYGSF